MWQNLSVGPQTKCDKCMAVCPAGREVIGDYLSDEEAYRVQVSDRLRDKPETVYVVPGSDAEASVTKRFPAKAVKRVGNGLRPNSPRNFLGALPLIFQRDQAEGLDATYHFTFTGIGALRGHGSDQGQDHHGQRRAWWGRPTCASPPTAPRGSPFLAKEKGLAAALLVAHD